MSFHTAATPSLQRMPVIGGGGQTEPGDGTSLARSHSRSRPASGEKVQVTRDLSMIGSEVLTSAVSAAVVAETGLFFAIA